MGKIKRSLFAAFLKTGVTTGQTPTPIWSRMGKGITSQKISYNPTVTTEQYIDEDNATSSVDSYAPALDGTQTAYTEDAVFSWLDEKRQARGVGSNVETELLLVYLYDSTESGGTTTYNAEKNNCVIQFGDFGGDGGGNVQITYAIGLNGDPVIGTCTMANGVPTFTPNT